VPTAVGPGLVPVAGVQSQQPVQSVRTTVGRARCRPRAPTTAGATGDRAAGAGTGAAAGTVGSWHPFMVSQGSRLPRVRLVIARCSVNYEGRLRAHLPQATRLLMVKADGSVLVHSDGGSYKPLNWMSPPATLRVAPPSGELAEEGVSEVWTVQSTKADDRLVVHVFEVLHDSAHELGVDPGLVKDGVEADLQRLLAEQIELLGQGHSLVRREHMTAIGPVDILARDPEGGTVAVELKRRGDIDGVEQLTRYLELMNRDPLLAPVRGVFAAQQIRPQARTLAEDRGIRCLTLDYDAMRGVDDAESRLF
jgi:endonuclease